MNLESFHRQSIEDREGFWAKQAELIHWNKPFGQVLDYSKPPFARWFLGGETNLCFNAIDRHLASQADKPALIYVSTETGEEDTYSFRQLHEEVMRMAAIIGVVQIVTLLSALLFQTPVLKRVYGLEGRE